jgi:hypothetical protein
MQRLSRDSDPSISNLIRFGNRDVPWIVPFAPSSFIIHAFLRFSRDLQQNPDLEIIGRSRCMKLVRGD